MSKARRAGAPVIEVTEKMVLVGADILNNVCNELTSSSSRILAEQVFRAIAEQASYRVLVLPS